MRITEELKLFDEACVKLTELLAENDLGYTFSRGEYPVILSVSPNVDPSDQVELFPNDNQYSPAKDAKLDFIFQDGDVIIRTDSRLVLPEALMNKIKLSAKKLYSLYLQAFYRDQITATSQE